MKSHQWDDSSDVVGEGSESAKDFFDSVGILQEDELEAPSDRHMHRRRLTELRRRAEERLDWKRLCGDLDSDEDYDLSDCEDTLFGEH